MSDSYVLVCRTCGGYPPGDASGAGDVCVCGQPPRDRALLEENARVRNALVAAEARADRAEAFRDRWKRATRLYWLRVRNVADLVAAIQAGTVAAEERAERAEKQVRDLEQAVAVLAEGIDLPLCGVEAIAEAIASQQPGLSVALWDRAQDIRKLLADPAVRRVLGEKEAVKNDG